MSKILGSGDGPVAISEKVIQAIRGRTAGNNLISLEEEWNEGDILQITSGPFRELKGVFQNRMSDQGRVMILLSLIGVEVPVQISKWQLKKVA